LKLLDSLQAYLAGSDILALLFNQAPAPKEPVVDHSWHGPDPTPRLMILCQDEGHFIMCRYLIKFEGYSIENTCLIPPVYDPCPTTPGPPGRPVVLRPDLHIETHLVSASGQALCLKSAQDATDNLNNLIFDQANCSVTRRHHVRYLIDNYVFAEADSTEICMPPKQPGYSTASISK
jgi:hypothetical protein